jgi:hypothetical protein
MLSTECSWDRFAQFPAYCICEFLHLSSLKQVKAWVPIDGTYDLGAGPRIDPTVQEQAYRPLTMAARTVRLNIKRQNNLNSKPY